MTVDQPSESRAEATDNRRRRLLKGSETKATEKIVRRWNSVAFIAESHMGLNDCAAMDGSNSKGKDGSEITILLLMRDRLTRRKVRLTGVVKEGHAGR